MLVQEVMNRLRQQYSARKRGHDILLLDINTLNLVHVVNEGSRKELGTSLLPLNNCIDDFCDHCLTGY